MTVIFNKKNIKQASASHKNSYLILIYFFYQWQQNQLVEVLHSSIALIQQHVNSSISEEDQLKFDVDTVTYYRLIAKLAFILKSQIEARGALALQSHSKVLELLAGLHNPQPSHKPPKITLRARARWPSGRKKTLNK